MVIIPFSPILCAVVTTMMLVLTFYTGSWCRIKQMINRIEKEVQQYECEEREEE